MIDLIPTGSPDIGFLAWFAASPALEIRSDVAAAPWSYLEAP